MAEPLPDRRDTGQASGARVAARRPRWVIAVLALTILLVVVVAVLHLSGNSLGGHGGDLP